MKFKYLLCLVLIVILTGCKATYNLEIKNKDFIENISITDNRSLDYFKNNKFYAIMDGASNFKEYNKKVEKDSKVKFKYSYNINDYRKATILKTCFKAYSVIDEKDYYLLSTSTGVKCAKEEDAVLLDGLKIVIKTNHKVKESNADQVKGYVYTWNIKKDDYDNARIYIKLYKDKYVFNYDNEFVITVLIISSILLIIALLTFIIIKKVKKAGNL